MPRSKLDDIDGSDAFFRFPSTPHLTWLGRMPPPRDDKLLTDRERRDLLVGEVIVEEKLDGANLGFSVSHFGRVQAQNRGQYLSEPYSGQFSRLAAWLGQHQDQLLSLLEPKLILFGEWCAARHSLRYDALADWFLVFDVYDRVAGKFWSCQRRDALASWANLTTVPKLARGHMSVTSLESLVMNTQSRFATTGTVEGVVVRQDSKDWCERRAKLVHPNFNQEIDAHWSKRTLEWNIQARS